MFSPHTRGCSVLEQPVYRAIFVFPAYAGMFLAQLIRWKRLGSFPRIRGDVPCSSLYRLCYLPFSPRMRGCSFALVIGDGFDHVFPAYAGMFRSQCAVSRGHARFPRVCGDVPILIPPQAVENRFSPRMRGCSWAKSDAAKTEAVFPAYAGMFRHIAHLQLQGTCFPRVCGDVPGLWCL